jgi:hypothetical protein
MGQIRCPACKKLLARQSPRGGVEMLRDGFVITVRAGHIDCACGHTRILVGHTLDDQGVEVDHLSVISTLPRPRAGGEGHDGVVVESELAGVRRSGS